jgi:predicted ATPase
LCEELVTRRLIVEAEGVYRVAHSLIAEVVRRELTVSHRRELHRAIALALQEMASDNTRHELRDSAHHAMAGRIARHAEYGGEGQMACRYAMEASANALGRYGPEEALFWLDLAAVTAKGREQSDEVNRLTAEVLEFAGLTEAPRGMRRTSATLASLGQEDLDFS